MENWIESTNESRKSMEEYINEIAAYVASHVENYELYLQLALDRMDRTRCPFWMAADEGFYNEITSAIEDWCWDHDIDYDDWDFEELIEGEDGIIWQ